MKDHTLDTIKPHGVAATLEDLLALRFAAQAISFKSHPYKLKEGSGNHLSRQRGRGVEFEEVRIYQPGDDIRNIDWRVTARSGRTYTRLFREEQERPLFISVDQRSPMAFGSQVCFKSVMASHLTALISWAGLQGGDRIGSLIFSNHRQLDLKPLRQRRHVLQLLQDICQFNQELLQLLTQNTYPSLSEQLLNLRRVSKTGSSIFLLSDFHDWDSDCNDHLNHLGKHSDVTLIRIYDPLEKQLPQSGIYSITDGQQRLSIDTSDTALCKKHSERFDAITRQLQEVSSKIFATFIQVSTNDDPLLRLKKYFGNR